MKPTEPVNDVFAFRDSCKVYVLKKGASGLAIDFGTGEFLKHLSRTGIERLDAVLITHPHRDQCRGLLDRENWPFEIHASGGAADFLSPASVKSFWKQGGGAGVPSNYLQLRRGIAAARLDQRESSDFAWRDLRVRAIPTPGHTDAALTYLVDWNGRTLAFCGDALCGPGKVWEPYHLEWDHWTAKGARRAVWGLTRLGNVRLDALLPSHGETMTEPAGAIEKTIRRLRGLIAAKDCIAPRVEEKWLPLRPRTDGIRRVLPHLYQFGMNGYVLVSESGEGLVIDPMPSDLGVLEAIRRETPVDSYTAATASHYHSDHVNGLGPVRERFESEVWLHPLLVPLCTDPPAWRRPWLPDRIEPVDRTLPDRGKVRWNEYTVHVFPYPGQTRYHCGLCTAVDGRKVLFSGDNFHPPSRWGGSGGFCAFNEGHPSYYRESARKALELRPDIVCAGHGSFYAFLPEHFRAVVEWSRRAEDALRALAPGEPWMSHYDCHLIDVRPYRMTARPGGSFSLDVHMRNHREQSVRWDLRPIPPDGWRAQPEVRQCRVEPGGAGKATFEVSVPKSEQPRRAVVTVEAGPNGRRPVEMAEGLVDVTPAS